MAKPCSLTTLALQHASTHAADSEAKGINHALITYISIVPIEESDIFVIGCDSTSAGRAMSKGWSGVDDIDAEIILFNSLIGAHRFIIMETPGSLNVADEPSRGKPISEAKREASFARLKKASHFLERNFTWVDRHLSS